jgi:hypothetical protein
VLSSGCPFCKQQREEDQRKGVNPTQNLEPASQTHAAGSEDGQFPDPFSKKAHWDLKKAHGCRGHAFEETDLTKGETQFGGDKGKENVDRIGKPVVDKMKGTVR